jgi:alpha-ribazole phosphatase CobZ
MARVMTAGVGQPVGVFGFILRLRMAPWAMSSESRTGVSTVFSGEGPAPETPGTVEMRVFPRTTAKSGRAGRAGGLPERNGIPISIRSRDKKMDLIMFGIAERLGAKGAGLPEMVEAAMALYVPHGVPPEQARELIAGKIAKAMQDPNISSLLLAAVLLEEELCTGRPGTIGGDPVFLLSDEILGMAIAEYIGGTCARFEFTRYDQKKPGILGRLGPFLDDAVAGLIAGCTSKFYSECVA